MFKLLKEINWKYLRYDGSLEVFSFLKKLNNVPMVEFYKQHSDLYIQTMTSNILINKNDYILRLEVNDYIVLKNHLFKKYFGENL